MARQIKMDGLALGLKLPETLRDGMADSAPVHRSSPGAPRRPCLWKLSWTAGCRPGNPWPWPNRSTSSGARKWRAVTRDPKMLLLAKRVLGYNPQKIEISLRWSFPTRLSLTEHCNIDLASRWHYDVIGKNSMSLFFYIVKGDSDLDGAHATILKSHRKKKISMLFRPSTTISEAELISYYGPGQVVIATGEPGDGFAEDPNTFHRAMQPISSPRLVLLVRYTLGVGQPCGGGEGNPCPAPFGSGCGPCA